VTNNKAIESGEKFFRKLACLEMNEHERAVYDLKIQRDALYRISHQYHCEKLYLQRSKPPGPNLDRALGKLDTQYPLGYARRELVAVNASIKEAKVALDHFRAGNLKRGQHLDTRRTNLGRS
jgi:hypothetical protein